MIKENIIRIASDTKYYGLKNLFTHKIKYKNRKCGDIIFLELITKKSKIISMRYETDSCIFCQASASILARSIKIFKIDKINNDIKLLKDFFKNKKKRLPKRLHCFKKILLRDYLKRSECVMMPFNALLKALKL